jgi:2-oxoglutarate dehydrogenase E2 component (dihydrolipoamide succinyltransferase)
VITEVRLPKEDANDSTAVVVAWPVRDGQPVAAGDPLVEVETSKVTAEIVASADGYVVPAAPLGYEAKVGDVLAYLCADRDELEEARARLSRTRGAAAMADPGSEEQRFSPAALAYLAEQGIPRERFADLAIVTLGDVRDAVADQQPGDGAAPASERLSRAKSLEIERLNRANVLNASLSVQFDGTAVREWASSADVPSVRLLAAAVHAIGRSLPGRQGLSAWFDDGVRHHETIGIGIAIDLDDGLKVGVVHEADWLDLAQIERRIAQLVSGYLNGTLTLADVSGGTMTISDLSVDDVLIFQPLLNDRQGLAIGLGGDRNLPGRPLSLTATFDHRVTTGREVSQFLADCRRRMAELTAPNAGKRR